VTDKGGNGSDSEGFSFGGLIKAVKSVRQKMVPLYAALPRINIVMFVAGQVLWRVAHQ
jgi:hypothetical protein